MFSLKFYDNIVHDFMYIKAFLYDFIGNLLRNADINEFIYLFFHILLLCDDGIN